MEVDLHSGLTESISEATEKGKAVALGELIVRLNPKLLKYGWIYDFMRDRRTVELYSE